MEPEVCECSHYVLLRPNILRNLVCEVFKFRGGTTSTSMALMEFVLMLHDTSTGEADGR